MLDKGLPHIRTFGHISIITHPRVRFILGIAFTMLVASVVVSAVSLGLLKNI